MISPILQRLTQLYRQMDAAYRDVALAQGFECRGCEENCCRSRFYHHTLIEHLMLQTGIERLSMEQRREVTGRALEVQSRETAGGLLCPLNEAGRCALYDHRPMICRLHGVPHRLQLPDGRIHSGPGCAECERRRGGGAERRLDRTPFYRAMADLEQEARRVTGTCAKRRITIAEMVLHPPQGGLGNRSGVQRSAP